MRVFFIVAAEVETDLACTDALEKLASFRTRLSEDGSIILKIPKDVAVSNPEPNSTRLTP